MSLLQAYRDHCESNDFRIDADQVTAAETLDRFAENALAGTGKRGLYFWGQVGRGKTMLMDLFYREAPGRKKRLHFHALIREVRDRLARETGPNPMHRVAAVIAPPGTLICIDEMHLSDVDNTLVIEILLSELLRNRLVIVTTSNFAPDELIPDEIGVSHASVEDSGLPGPLFLESRDQIMRMIQQNFEVLKVGGTADYRQNANLGVGAYIQSRSPEQQIESFLLDLEVGAVITKESSVFGRPVPFVRRYERALWLNYADLCERAFSYRDYLELFNGIESVILQDVNVASLDGAKRLGWLVEVVYDSAKRLVLTSHKSIDSLFSDVAIPPHLKIEFRRVESRIKELTS